MHWSVLAFGHFWENAFNRVEADRSAERSRMWTQRSGWPPVAGLQAMRWIFRRHRFIFQESVELAAFLVPADSSGEDLKHSTHTHHRGERQRWRNNHEHTYTHTSMSCRDLWISVSCSLVSYLVSHLTVHYPSRENEQLSGLSTMYIFLAFSFCFIVYIINPFLLFMVKTISLHHPEQAKKLHLCHRLT